MTSSTGCAATTEQPLVLEPEPSSHAVQWLFWLHALPLAIMVLAVPPGPLLAALAAGVGASWLWLRRHPVFGFGPRALVRLTWHPGGDWTLHQAGGRQVEAQLLGGSVVMDGFLLLSFRCADGARCARVLLGEEVGEEPMRRLRVRLRRLRG